ncbi:MAG: hypothetical protein ACLQF2_11610 [Rhodomicrobium sp.]
MADDPINILHRHCEPRLGGRGKLREAIQGQVSDVAMDRHGGESRLAMTAAPIPESNARDIVEA